MMRRINSDPLIRCRTAHIRIAGASTSGSSWATPATAEQIDESIRLLHSEAAGYIDRVAEIMQFEGVSR